MVQRRVVATAVIIVAFLVAAFVPACADDTAVAVAAGGIQLRKEARISMDKERLTITPDKVSVDFLFHNETDTDITTEVAFPIPAYQFEFDSLNWPYDFADFKLWVDDQPISYETDVHAKLNGKDYTEPLRSLGIDVATFGEYDWKKDPPDGSPQILKLSPSNKARLVQLGLLDNLDNAFPKWTVIKMYYWRQTFPAGKLVHIRHQYTPVAGFEPVQVDNISRRFPDSCVDASLRQKLGSLAANDLQRTNGGSNNYIAATWVKYILTTANTWKTPIKNFRLDVEVPTGGSDHASFISLCGGDKVTNASQNHVVMSISNFVPSRDLTVYFFKD